MLVLSADHLIADKDAFQAAVTKAIELSAQGNLVTFGIHAKTPETGFGYIESDGNKVLRFVEKPSAEKAQAYIDAGNFHWNSGMFCFTADALIKQMAEHAPEIHHAVKTCLDLSSVEKMSGGDRVLLDSASFEAVPKNSIDYALMEKSKQVSVVPCDIGWSDIGSWLALTDLLVPDAMNNRANGDVLLHDANNVSVHAKDRLVSVVGLCDIIVVDTGDAVLVVNKQDTQKVKLIYEAVKIADDPRHRLHDEVHRPWGTYKVLQYAEAFKVKRILVKPGQRLSLQSHQHRAEHWVVVKGIAEVINNDKQLTLNEGESTFIEAGHQHQLYNPGINTLEIIEVQTGTYLGEDDIERFADSYGRV
jgi:mannose-1-phosphate guanylyltransferase